MVTKTSETKKWRKKNLKRINLVLSLNLRFLLRHSPKKKKQFAYYRDTLHHFYSPFAKCAWSFFAMKNRYGQNAHRQYYIVCIGWKFNLGLMQKKKKEKNKKPIRQMSANGAFLRVTRKCTCTYLKKKKTVQSVCSHFENNDPFQFTIRNCVSSVCTLCSLRMIELRTNCGT